jgi:hypothetical protein
MTIGIAASGPGAARAILEALAAAESVGKGAIGGFISVAAIGEGVLHRCESQRDGARGLLDQGLPDTIALASLAVLMSSGPDRPEPLSQFTPGDANVGLVTGHRFPNMPGKDGLGLAASALQRMREGKTPEEAAEEVAEANSAADAGLICMDLNGQIGVANTRYVAAFPGLGQAVRSIGQARVAVLCNAIAPASPIADLVADLALASMQPPLDCGEVNLSAGVPVRWGREPEVLVDDALQLLEVHLPGPQPPDGSWSGGYGPLARLTSAGRVLGYLLDEPFLTGRTNQIEGIDGSSRKPVRFLRHATQATVSLSQGASTISE